MKKSVYFVGQTKSILKKMTGAYEKLLFSSSKTSHLNAYDQEDLRSGRQRRRWGG